MGVDRSTMTAARERVLVRFGHALHVHTCGCLRSTATVLDVTKAEAVSGGIVDVSVWTGAQGALCDRGLWQCPATMPASVFRARSELIWGSSGCDMASSELS